MSSPRLRALSLEDPGDAGLWTRRWRRIRTLLRPPRRLRVTPAGRTYLVVTVGIGLGALNTGNNLLYLVLGLLLSVIVVSGVLSERCLRGLRVRRIGAEAAFAGEPFAYRWALLRERGGAYALEITEAHPDLQGTASLAHLPAGREVVVRGDLLALKRGPHHLGEIRVTTSFPFGLFAKTRVFPSESTLLVYPRRVGAPPFDGRAEAGADGASTSPRATGGAGDVAGLSPLREGDDARRIHWGRSAALGAWVRVEREREERQTWLLQAPGDTTTEALERACESLAAVAHQLIAQGHEVGLQTPETRLRPASGPAQERRILSALANLGFQTRTHAATAQEPRS